MKRFTAVLLAVLFLPRLSAAPPPAREEAVFLFENRKVVLALPAGFTLERASDPNGLVSIRLEDAPGRISGEIRFLPDGEHRFLAARPRRELMHELFGEYVAASTEQGMQFEELEPRAGAGTYCVFTDAKLVGKATLPPGEFLHLTVGLKAWPGVVAIFRFFSQDRSSADYQAVLRLLRESVEERGVPLK